MKLELAIVLECDATGCRVQYVDNGEISTAEYSAPVRDRIRIRRNQLVAIDSGAQPARIVWRLFHGKVHAVEDHTVLVSRLDGDVEHTDDAGHVWLRHVTPVPDLDTPVAIGDIVFYECQKTEDTGELHDVAVNGRPAHRARVAARLYPKIESTYAALDS